MLFIFFFSIGIGPLPWVINGELFPEECKAASASLSAVVNFFMAFTVTKTVVNLQGWLGYSGTYFLYGSLSMVGAIYIFFGVPETKGKSPEVILQYFGIGQKQKELSRKINRDAGDFKSQDNSDPPPDTPFITTTI